MSSIASVASAAAELAANFGGQLLKPADVGYEGHSSRSERMANT